MRTRTCLFALICGSFPAVPLTADIIPPGYKPVDHLVHFFNHADFPDYVLYAYPRDLSRGRPGNSTVRVGSDGTVAISGFNPLAVGEEGGVFVFAVPTVLHESGQPPKEEWFTGPCQGVFKASIVSPRGNARKSDSVSKVITTYRISGLPDAFQVALINEEEKHSATTGGEPPETAAGIFESPWTLALLLGIPAIAVVLLVVRTRAKRSNAQSSASP